MSAPYVGDFPADQAIYFLWDTNDANGASITRSADGTISVYKDNSDGSSFDETQVTTGITNDEDFDGLTGIHECCITTTDAWYEVGHDYTVVLSAATIDEQTVNAVLARFSIENRFMRGTNSAALASAVSTLQTAVTAIKAKTDNLPSNIPKGVAFPDFTFFMADSANHASPKTGLTVTATISKDGGAFAACTNAVAEIASGFYKIDLTATEMNADTITVKFTATGADQAGITMKTDT